MITGLIFILAFTTVLAGKKYIIETGLGRCHKNQRGDQPRAFFFPAGVRVFPVGNLQNPQEILAKSLIIGHIL